MIKSIVIHGRNFKINQNFLDTIILNNNNKCLYSLKIDTISFDNHTYQNKEWIVL